MRSIPLAVVLAALVSTGCEEPPPNQPEGERCSMVLPDYQRCRPPLYCHPPSGIRSFVRSEAGPVGLCKRYLAEGENCASGAADCEPGLDCERQSGVCRPSSGISHDKHVEQ